MVNIPGTLKILYRNRLIKTNINDFLDKIETEDTLKDYLSVEELYKLAETPCKKPILKTAALFSCLTSLRISDILSLQWHEIIDFAAGGKCVHTITQKTKTEDIIPISDEALQLIGYSPEKTGLVFKGLKRSWTQQPMKEWIREAGITKNITSTPIEEHTQHFKEQLAQTYVPFKVTWHIKVSPRHNGT